MPNRGDAITPGRSQCAIPAKTNGPLPWIVKMLHQKQETIIRHFYRKSINIFMMNYRVPPEGYLRSVAGSKLDFQ